MQLGYFYNIKAIWNQWNIYAKVKKYNLFNNFRMVKKAIFFDFPKLKALKSILASELIKIE